MKTTELCLSCVHGPKQESSSLLLLVIVIAVFKLLGIAAFWVPAAAQKLTVDRAPQHDVPFAAFRAFPFYLAFGYCLGFLAGISLKILARAFWVKAEFHWLPCFLYSKDFRKSACFAVFLCWLYQRIFWQRENSFAVRVFV